MPRHPSQGGSAGSNPVGATEVAAQRYLTIHDADTRPGNLRNLSPDEALPLAAIDLAVMYCVALGSYPRDRL
jgi:hypothetical protein